MSVKVFTCNYGALKLITLEPFYHKALAGFNRHLKGYTCGTITLETTAYHIDYIKVSNGLYDLAVKFNDTNLLNCGKYRDINKLLCDDVFK